MSADAKVWKDDTGWHGISDFTDEVFHESEYDLTTVLLMVETAAQQQLDWEIFTYSDGSLGLKGYRAK